MALRIPPPEFWKDFIETVGAFSCAEAIALYGLVRECEQGDFIELGSHKGRSSICIAAAMPKVSRLVLVEPEFIDSEWAQNVLGKVYKWLPENVIGTGFGSGSTTALNLFNEISFCLVDSGTHSDDLVMTETKMLEDKIIKGGILAYHDKGSQFTKVDEAYNYALSTGKFEEILFDWDEIFNYLKANNIEDGELSWHKYPELPHPPNFIGALRRK